MNTVHRLIDWLESHWVVPAYSGWVMVGLTLFFFGAATNSMSGWLYVISGVSLALLVMAVILSVRSLRGIHVRRLTIDPVSAGDSLAIKLEIENQTDQPKTLLLVRDLLPYVLNEPVSVAVEAIPAGGVYRWVYQQPAQRRGVYRWHDLQLRAATPLGLFWCRRSRLVRAKAVVYPPVLPLLQCPLLDEIGEEVSPQFYARDRRDQSASEGMTRSLRPYRWGDPTRLIHWRTSARYGELRVRELEIFTGGQDIMICLDSASHWQEENFEQAAIAAASLYFYACRAQQSARLWTARTGLLQGDRRVLEALAATHFGETPGSDVTLPDHPLIWLSQNAASLSTLPNGSRWLLWPEASASAASDDRPERSSTGSQTAPSISMHPGLTIDPAQLLQPQLQRGLR